MYLLNDCSVVFVFLQNRFSSCPIFIFMLVEHLIGLC